MKEYMTWQEFEYLIENIAKEIAKTGKLYDRIYAIPRGGLVPAVCIAHKLCIPEITTNILYIDPNTLIVEDITDSGDTLRPYLKHHWENIACLIRKRCSDVRPRFIGKEISSSLWIVFPWELKDSKEEKDHK